MNPHAAPAPFPPEALGDSTVLVVHSAQAGRIKVEVVHASPEHRRHLEPCLRFLRTLPKPPAPERISITLAGPNLLGLLLEGRLWVGSVEMVERVVGLHVILPDDRWGQSGPVAAWVATFRDRLRARLIGPGRRHAARGQRGVGHASRTTHGDATSHV